MDKTTPKRQLELWAEGKSVHSVNKGIEECCPDFSCCDERLLVDAETRHQYIEAVRTHDDRTKNRLLVGFLQKMLQRRGYRVDVG